MQPIGVLAVEDEGNLVAHCARTRSDGFVERIGVDLLDGNAVGIDAVVDTVSDGMPACAWLGADEAKADSFWEFECHLRLGVKLEFDFKL